MCPVSEVEPFTLAVSVVQHKPPNKLALRGSAMVSGMQNMNILPSSAHWLVADSREFSAVCSRCARADQIHRCSNLECHAIKDLCATRQGVKRRPWFFPIRNRARNCTLRRSRNGDRGCPLLLIDTDRTRHCAPLNADIKQEGNPAEDQRC